jgi:hypothetical protein
LIANSNSDLCDRSASSVILSLLEANQAASATRRARVGPALTLEADQSPARQIGLIKPISLENESKAEY